MGRYCVASLLIQGGHVIDPASRLNGPADILVIDGKIAAVGKNLEAPKENCRTIDANGKVVTPGWIDAHTHLREPGAPHKETIRSGSESAAAGGFTTIACMANTLPVNDNALVTTYLQDRIKKEAVVNVHCIGAITKGLEGEQLAEIGNMTEAGIIGISDDGMTVMNSYLMRKAMDYSRRFDLPVITHCEDCYLKGRGVMNEGFNSMRFGLRGIPKASEEIIVARDLVLAELTGAKLHIAHVSTLGSVTLIREAKRRGLQVTAEATPHHLTLTDESVGSYDTSTKVAPPLREKADVEALAEAVADGTVDILATDHAPHSLLEKDIEYDQAAFGMVGLEIAFPIYNRLVQSRVTDLNRIIEAMTIKPAQLLNVDRGTLAVGKVADITIFDPKASYKIDKTRFKSKSQNTPFHGWDVTGRVEMTILAGKVVYSHV